MAKFYFEVLKKNYPQKRYYFCVSFLFFKKNILLHENKKTLCLWYPD